MVATTLRDLRSAGGVGKQGSWRLPVTGELDVEARFVYVEYVSSSSAELGLVEVKMTKRSTQERHRIALNVPSGHVMVCVAVKKGFRLSCVEAKNVSVDAAWTSDSDYSLEPRDAPMGGRHCRWISYSSNGSPRRKVVSDQVVVVTANDALATLPEDRGQDEREEDKVFELSCRIGPCSHLTSVGGCPVGISGRAIYRIGGSSYSWWHPGHEKISHVASHSDTLACASDSRVSLWVRERWVCDWVPHGVEGRVVALSFSEDGSEMCTAGLDKRKRPALAVWNASRLALDSSVACVARQLADFDVACIRWSPLEGLVSCGKENVRFWRLDRDRSRLSGSSATLHEYARKASKLIDLAFGTEKKVIVASDQGYILQVSHSAREIICAFKIHSAAIRRVRIDPSTGVVATCSDDGLVRIWPDDNFADYAMEARRPLHTSPFVDILPDGPDKYLCAQRDGSLGIFDLLDRSYEIKSTAHSSAILDISTQEDLVATCCSKVVRVWRETAQVAEFFAEEAEKGSSMSRILLLDQSRIVVGFASGKVLEFDFFKRPLPQAYHEHLYGPVQRLCSREKVFYSAGADGLLASYDEKGVSNSCRIDNSHALSTTRKPQDIDLVVSETGTVAALTSRDPDSIFLFDTFLNRVSTIVLGQPLTSIAFGGGGGLLWVFSAPSRRRYKVDATKAAVLASFQEDSPHVLALHQDDDCLTAKIGIDDNVIELSTTTSRQRLGDAHSGKVTRVVFSRRGDAMVSGDSDGSVCFWKKLRESACALYAFAKECNDARWRHDDLLVVGGLSDRVVATNFREEWQRPTKEPVVKVALGSSLVAIATTSRIITFSESLDAELSNVDFPETFFLSVAKEDEVFAASRDAFLFREETTKMRIDSACSVNSQIIVASDTDLVEVQHERRLLGSTPYVATAIAASENTIACASSTGIVSLADYSGEDDRWQPVLQEKEDIVDLVVSEDKQRQERLYVATRYALKIFDIFPTGIYPQALLRVDSTIVSIDVHPRACLIYQKDGVVLSYITNPRG